MIEFININIISLSNIQIKKSKLYITKKFNMKLEQETKQQDPKERCEFAFGRFVFVHIYLFLFCQ